MLERKYWIPLSLFRSSLCAARCAFSRCASCSLSPVSSFRSALCALRYAFFPYALCSMLYALSALLIVGLWCSAPLAEGQKAGDSTGMGAVGEKSDPAYIISPGDALDISVWKEEALTKTLIVLPDGRISFPLIGELTAAGKTVAQIKEELKEKLAPYVTVPIVSVEVKQTGSMLIYVIGRVNNPGRFVVNAHVNVLQALATAGGLNPFAKRKKIKIMRTEGETTRMFLFNYDDIADGKNLKQNIWLQKGDVIVVP